MLLICPPVMATVTLSASAVSPCTVTPSHVESEYPVHSTVHVLVPHVKSSSLHAPSPEHCNPQSAFSGAQNKGHGVVHPMTDRRSRNGHWNRMSLHAVEEQWRAHCAVGAVVGGGVGVAFGADVSTTASRHLSVPPVQVKSTDVSPRTTPPSTSDVASTSIDRQTPFPEPVHVTVTADAVSACRACTCMPWQTLPATPPAHVAAHGPRPWRGQ
jgi:hypothetical protein